MQDKFQELNSVLIEVVELLKEFETSSDEYLKPKIRANLVKASSLGKIINGQVLERVNRLIEDIDLFLTSKEHAHLFNKVMQDALSLKNNLWEL